MPKSPKSVVPKLTEADMLNSLRKEATEAVLHTARREKGSVGCGTAG